VAFGYGIRLEPQLAGYLRGGYIRDDTVCRGLAAISFGIGLFVGIHVPYVLYVL
jgi:hypothetical protein